jgi:superfamily II DNA helicase RecQ
MAYAFFKIPSAPDSAQLTEELNAFLRRHSVLNVQREWVAAGDASFWAFSIHYKETGTATTGAAATASRGPKVDYREVLTEEQFAVFRRLRDLRQTLAQRDGVVVYTIFTNEQMAEMVKRGATTLAALREIPGVGEARTAKYGQDMLTVLHPSSLAP